jgi:KUP system potassium uptake protein
MLIGAALIAGMLIWSRGRTALMERYSSRYPTLEAARPLIQKALCSRVPGTAVFLSPSADHIPPILVHHVERSKSLHEHVVLLHVEKANVPVVPPESRFRMTNLEDGFHRLVISFGYMETPNLTPILSEVTRTESPHLDFDNATYYIGHESFIAGNDGVIGRVPEAIFAYLNRNAAQEEKNYGMPTEQIVEIGTQIDL